MKLELQRQNFLKAWQIAERFSAPTTAKTPKDSISGIFITATEGNNVTLEATDLKTSCSCKAEGVNVLEPGFAVIPASIFGGMLKKSASDDLILEINSSRGFLSSGRNKTRFTIISPEEFPKIPQSSSAEEICTMLGADISSLINEGATAASQPMDFPKYMGTCLLKTEENTVRCLSTDGKRLSISKFPYEIKKADELLLPANAMKDFAKMIAANYSDKNIKILADGSTVWFNIEDVEFSARRIDANFPKYERILNNEVRTKLTISTGELLSVIERIDVIAKNTPMHLMIMELNPEGKLTISTRAPEMGTASEIIDAKVEGEFLRIGFNVPYLQDGLKAVGAGNAYIEFSSDEGQTRIYRDGHDDFLYMVMPTRLTSQDLISDDDESNDYQPQNEQERESEN